MNEQLKKKLTSNWFKILQESICKDIEKLEGRKKIFKSKNWIRNKKKMKVGGNLEFLKMEEYLTKLE